LAAEIANRLIELGFDPYVAVGEQSLRGLKENLFEQLNRSEYFLFVDFKREGLVGKDLHRGSLFSHQELAVASFLEIEVLALQEQGVKKDDGILRFVQANALSFSDREKLPDLVAEQVKKRIDSEDWSPRWRNELVLERPPIRQNDIMMEGPQGPHKYFHIGVRNLHRRKIAMNCCAYSVKAVSLNSGAEITFKTFELKWEAYNLPNANIPAESDRSFDAFCIHRDQPNKLAFYAFCDASYILPQIVSPGRYELTYLVVAENFAPARRSFILTLSESPDSTILEPSANL
jgi:hypothetical protein